MKQTKTNILFVLEDFGEKKVKKKEVGGKSWNSIILQERGREKWERRESMWLDPNLESNPIPFD